ncbi:hypothetical protein C4561_01375 [candidate division WWE3 bacterium]|uniref:Uncharacterized protein n=1 Tax=candidate division WWE3 bacterium TaxID=2053526 RepID=A0A3A4ZF16_UNCKA|nr:MAG: hypothetical protein C4561_01375 [candidate division WWE3 bacterium]
MMFTGLIMTMGLFSIVFLFAAGMVLFKVESTLPDWLFITLLIGLFGTFGLVMMSLWGLIRSFEKKGEK